MLVPPASQQPHPACGERIAGAAMPWHPGLEQEGSAQAWLPTWSAEKPSELLACEVLSMVWQQDVLNDARTATQGSCSWVPSCLQMASGKTRQWSPRRACSYWETNPEQRVGGEFCHSLGGRRKRGIRADGRSPPIWYWLWQAVVSMGLSCCFDPSLLIAGIAVSNV